MEHQLEQTQEGFWVIKNETHLNKWVRETKRLDHDQYLIPQIIRYISLNSVVIDVGANIGDHTIAYCNATGPNGIVIGYEPHPLAVECLRRNVPACLAFQCAVGASVGQVSFAADPANVGASHLSDGGDTVVQMTTLDSEFAQILSPLGWKTVSFIKIDVEGSEPEVLQGAERLITLYRPAILLEVNLGALERRGHTGDEIKDFMEKHQYRMLFIPPQHSWTDDQSDVLCLPF